ncbi:MAG: type II CRISPR RNA-guided endonuclease Cas9 [Ginsengibacter sp.]
MSKKILGLDLGTNSIGWAFIEQSTEKDNSKIIGMGSRILPMPLDILGKFDSGQSISQTAERTAFRGVRRLLERDLLRRERLHRVLNILNFLPKHYSDQIDFEQRLGQFKKGKEPKIAYKETTSKKFEFIFQNSFNEMVDDFKKNQPELFFTKRNGEESKIPYDWTIYYLRNKALTQKIEKEELAWLLLHFNQKRGYYQLRGEDENTDETKSVKFYSLKVNRVEAAEKGKSKDEIWYNVYLENGWIYRRSSKTILDWEGKQKEFIVTEDLNEDGSIKTDKDGKEKRSFKAVDSEQDWIAIKKSTEEKIEHSGETVGTYIYKTLLKKPNQKIRGKLIRTIERKFYKGELKLILAEQKKYHVELQSAELYKECLEELYAYNESHKNNVTNKDFIYLFIDDIIFYQRPLKSKKFLISNCPIETKSFQTEGGEIKNEPLKCIAKSHPLFQEFRLLQFLTNLKIFKKSEPADIDVTKDFIPSEEEKFKLLNWLNDKTDIDQKGFLKYFDLKKNADQYRWNYVEDKKYPLNETRGEIIKRLNKINLPTEWLDAESEVSLWHILYSVEDKIEIEKALQTFAKKNKLDDAFVDIFKKFPRIEKDYGSYSAKAIKKLLPLMRFGPNWNDKTIVDNMELYQQNIKEVIAKIDEKAVKKEADQNWVSKVKEKLLKLEGDLYEYKNLSKDIASYLVYKRNAEVGEVRFWKKPNEIELLKQHSLRNPIVEQVINETLQTIKDIWFEYGNGIENFFDEIHVELGREMKNPATIRERMTKKISENENTNLRIKALLVELMNDNDISNVRPYSPMQQEILKLYEEGVYENETDSEVLEEIDKIRKQNEPTTSELKRYKLWLEQGYISPYTGKMIPLNKLFTPAYEIEHIIPQSRFFDDSFSNKIICEAEVNSIKDNELAYEFIKNNPGLKIELTKGEFVDLLSLSDYEEHVKKYFAKSRSKMKKLLMEDIPDTFIERQLNDSRYISKVIKSLLSNIVRQEGETESTAKNVIVSNGAITSTLRQDWGLNDIWSELITPRFKRLNQITNSEKFGTINSKTNKFLPEVPLELSKGFSKKRIDHRHHALDALVVACSSRNHINYLNNESAKEKNKKGRIELRNKLRNLEIVESKKWQNGQWVIRKITVGKEFIKPWPNFTKNAKDALDNTIVSFKKNNRVINKTVNHYQKWIEQKDGTFKKQFTKQVKGDSWAIRKPLHTPMPYGLRNYLFDTLKIAENVGKRDLIINENVKKEVEKIFINCDKKITNTQNYLKKNPIKNIDGTEILVTDFLIENRKFRKRQPISKLSNRSNNGGITDLRQMIKFLNKVVDKKLKDELLIYLKENDNDINKAFSPDGIEAFNLKRKIPVYKLPIAESGEKRFSLGNNIGNKHKWVEASEGTNLFFAIYVNEDGKRTFETIPLNVVIENQKLGAINKEKPLDCSVPKKNESGDTLLFSLSPNDLVYVPTTEEIENPELVDFNKLDRLQVERIYKFVSCTDNEGHFVPNFYSSPILKNEMGTNNKNQNSLDNIQIKSVCWKLLSNRLGKIISVNR